VHRSACHPPHGRLGNFPLDIEHGRRLRSTGRTAPKFNNNNNNKFEVEDGPCIRPPNISRSSLIGCVRKCELSKKMVLLRIFSNWPRGFSRQEMAIILYVLYITFQPAKTGKN